MTHERARGSRRTLAWLAGAVVLLVAAAALFDTDPPAPAATRTVEFPRFMDHRARERGQGRRSLVVPLASTADAGSPPPPARDPLLAALPPKGSAKVAVVVEANALVNSALGQAFLECLGPRQLEGLAELERISGVDPLRDVDRVASSDGVMIVSGHFAELAPSLSRAGGTLASRGAHAQVWTPDAHGSGEHVAVWKDELVMVARDRDALEAALARLEAVERGEATEAPAIAEGETYGEIYGSLSPEVFREVVPPELAERLEAVADRVALHVSAEDDLGLVVEMDGEDADRVDELARALGGALAVGRVKASAEGEAELAELMDLARVDRGGQRLSMELAVPREWLERRVLGPCRERAAADRARAEGPAPSAGSADAGAP